MAAQHRKTQGNRCIRARRLAAAGPATRSPSPIPLRPRSASVRWPRAAAEGPLRRAEGRAPAAPRSGVEAAAAAAGPRRVPGPVAGRASAGAARPALLPPQAGCGIFCRRQIRSTSVTSGAASSRSRPRCGRRRLSQRLPYQRVRKRRVPGHAAGCAFAGAAGPAPPTLQVGRDIFCRCQIRSTSVTSSAPSSRSRPRCGRSASACSSASSTSASASAASCTR